VGAPLKFKGVYLAQTAYVALGPTERACKKRLNEIAGHGRSDGPATHTDDVHVVILDPLTGRKVVVNQPGTDAGDLIGAHRRADTTAADCDTASYFARGDRPSERDYHVWIIVRRVQLISTEIDYVMSRCT
jgi:hypothetical protein